LTRRRDWLSLPYRVIDESLERSPYGLYRTRRRNKPGAVVVRAGRDVVQLAPLRLDCALNYCEFSASKNHNNPTRGRPRESEVPTGPSTIRTPPTQIEQYSPPRWRTGVRPFQRTPQPRQLGRGGRIAERAIRDTTEAVRTKPHGFPRTCRRIPCRCAATPRRRTTDFALFADTVETHARRAVATARTAVARVAPGVVARQHAGEQIGSVQARHGTRAAPVHRAARSTAPVDRTAWNGLHNERLGRRFDRCRPAARVPKQPVNMPLASGAPAAARSAIALPQLLARCCCKPSQGRRRVPFS